MTTTNQPSNKLNTNSSTHFDCESATSSLETITTRWKMENIYQENEIEQIAQGLKNIIDTPIQWCNKNNTIKNNMTKISCHRLHQKLPINNK